MIMQCVYWWCCSIKLFFALFLIILLVIIFPCFCFFFFGVVRIFILEVCQLFNVSTCRSCMFLYKKYLYWRSHHVHWLLLYFVFFFDRLHHFGSVFPYFYAVLVLSYGEWKKDHWLKVRVKPTYIWFLIPKFNTCLSHIHYVTWIHLISFCKKVNITKRYCHLHC